MNSSIHRLYKRLTAMVLAVCMITGMALWRPDMLAYASTELQDQDLGNGASEATAYTWKEDYVTGQGTADSREKSWRFDLRGLRAGQQSYDQASIKTTYRNGGYATFFQVGRGPGR